MIKENGRFLQLGMACLTLTFLYILFSSAFNRLLVENIFIGFVVL